MRQILHVFNSKLPIFTPQTIKTFALLLAGSLLTSFASAQDGFDDCSSITVNEIRVNPESTCGEHDGSISIFFSDKSGQGTYNILYEEKGEAYIKSWNFGSPVVLKSLKPGTYTNIRMRRVGEACEEKMPETYFRVISGCGNLADDLQQRSACGTGTFAYTNVLGETISINRENLNPSTVIFTSPNYGPGVISDVASDCSVTNDREVYCTEQGDANPGSYNYGTLTFNKRVGANHVGLSDLTAERINWLFCNYQSYSGCQSLQNALWEIIENDSSPGCLAAAAKSNVSSPQGGIANQMVFYEPSNPGAQTMIEKMCYTSQMPPMPADWAFGCSDFKNVDIYGVGANGNSTTTVSIPNGGNVYRTEVEVVYKGGNPGAYISVTDDAGNQYDLQRRTPVGGSSNVFVYSGQTGPTSSIIYANSGQTTQLQSVLVYAFRQNVTAVQSSGVFTYISGYNDIQSINIPIPPGTMTRNINVEIPISELTPDGRYLMATATAGGVSNSTIVYGPNTALGSCCLDILQLPLVNVPATATQVTITIDTRHNQNGQTVNGQSYVLAGAVKADVECCDITVDLGDNVSICNGTAILSPNVTGEGMCITGADCSNPGSVSGMTYLGAYDGHFYYINTTAVDYASALSYVNSRGGHLPKIISAAQNNWLQSQITQEVWLGATDEVTEGTFLWHDGSPLTYINWDSGEPNNNNNSDATRIMPSSGKWRDIETSASYATVMQIACPGSGMNNNVTYAWTGGSTGSSLTVSTSGQYCVTVTDCKGCENSDCVNVTVGSGATANDDTYSGCPGTNFSENVGDNDQNLNNPTFSLISTPASGVATLDTKGNLNFVASAGFCGVVDFEYEVCNESTEPGPSVPAEIYNGCSSGKKIDVYTYGLLNGSTSMNVPQVNNFERILVEIWVDSPGCPDINNLNSITIEGNTVFPTTVTNTSGAPQTERIFRTYLSSVSGNTVDFTFPSGCSPESGVLYVERLSANHSSSLVLNDMEFFRSSSASDCYSEELPIPVSANPRDVIVTIPIHEKDVASRPVTAEVTAGTIVLNQTLNTSNKGDGAGEFVFTIPNVPGNIDKISVEVCSPTPNGDSFGVGAITMTGTSCSPPTGGACCDIGKVTIDLNDNIPPTLNGVPGNLNLNCQDNVPAPANVTASDNCDTTVSPNFDEVSSKSNNPNDCNYYTYTITRTWIVTDDCLNTTSESQTINVVDDEDPVLSGLPDANINVSCEDVPDPAGVTVSDNCAANAFIDFNFTETSTQGNDPNNCNYYDYVITRTWTAEDPCGNSASFIQTINVSDNTNPVACCSDLSIQLDGNGNFTITPGDIDCGSADNCAGSNDLDLILSQTEFSYDDVGNTTVTLTVTDPCGNSDQCSSIITTDEFDLALDKKLKTGEDTRVYTGEEVTFTINVYNQGTIPASNIQVIDYIPTGMQLSDSDWSNNGGGTASITLPGTLQPGQKTSVDITLLVTSTVQEELINRAEIQSADAPNGFTNNDSDSNADGIPGNDAGGVVDSPTDNEINQRPPVDEDDADPENVYVEIFDLALRKTLNSTTQQPILNGRTVIFDIEVFNQGTVDAKGIQVTDYLPAQGLTLADPNWTDNAGIATYNQFLTIDAGQSQTISIAFTVDLEFDGLSLNVAEISSAQDDLGDNPQDIDSTPDQNNGNDAFVDNVINNDGGDQDDHDAEEIIVKRFDLALTKTFNTNSESPIAQNRDVIFDINITNQGTVRATEIELTDYIPTGLTLNDPNWSITAGNRAVYNNLLSLNAGQSQTVSITFTVDNDVTGTLVNRAEISDARDAFGANAIDIDSTPDDIEGNDPGGQVNTSDDDNISENGKQGGDEDDSDPEDITVETFDLALEKTLNSGTQQPIVAGRTVTFDITVTNEGSIDATQIEITDYVPAGLTLADNNWSMSGGNAVYNSTLDLAVGESETIQISFTVDAFVEGTLVNFAEISDARDEDGDSIDDIDSTPDNENNDLPAEDDHDDEEILVERFDLALIKLFNPVSSELPLLQNRLATFEIQIANQGTLDATQIEISDYVPVGLTLEDPNWTFNSGIATYNQLLDIDAGENATIMITFRIDNGVTGILVNRAEISDAKDEFGADIEDYDSEADAAIGNDSGGQVNTSDDNNISENGKQGGDEDDEDPEDIFVETFDLALRKTLNSSTQQPIVAGRIITYDIQVFNQGAIDATGIEITDYVPAGLTLADANWTMNGNIAVYNNLLSLTAGDDQTIQISFTIDAFVEGMIENFAEISDARDEFGVPADDIDSSPDQLNNNDTVVDDEINNNNGDEDDSDIDQTTIQRFDLALIKLFNPAASDFPLLQNRLATFEIQIGNQGTVDATDIQISDYIPAGLTLEDPNWTASGGIATYNQLIDLAANDATSIMITFRIDTGVTGTLVNRAEISDAKDEFGAAIEDFDSTPDAVAGNDPGGEVNTPDDNNLSENGKQGGDEDDADPEDIFVETFDLALRKKLANQTQLPIAAGRTVTFDIEIINQGTVGVTGVQITDYVPAGLTLADNNWTMNGNLAVYNDLLNVPVGQTLFITIDFTVDAFVEGTLVNQAEISDARDEQGDPADDIDSTPDQIDNNDTTVDDVVDNTNGDEDDSDIAEISVEKFDLALIKLFNPANSDFPLLQNRLVTFEIQIGNQGTIDATGIEISDYIPSGLTLEDPNWTANGGIAVYNQLLNIEAGQSASIMIGNY